MAVDSLTGVRVREGRGVRVVAGGGVFVPAGEDIGIVVVGVLMGAKVACEHDVEFTATVSVSDDEATGAMVGGTASVGDSDSGVAD